MSERIVVSFFMAHAGLLPVTGRGYVGRSRALVNRADALGGSLIAFGSQLIAFSFDKALLQRPVTLAVSAVTDETHPDELGWACGLAEGPLEAALPNDARAFSWGPALASASALARVADPGEVLVDASLRARGELVTLGTKVARDHGRRLRGARLATHQPWRRISAEQVSRLEIPRLIGREDPSALLWMPGAVAILRADPGLGGTRVLQELAALVAPGACLTLAPSGSGLEPLGALRRALVRAHVQDSAHFEPELEPALRRLLAGDGVPLETAAAIVASFLRSAGDDASPGALLVDDANDVDATSIDVCARAVAANERSFVCVVRLDETSAPPAAFAGLPKGPEMALAPLSVEDAGVLAAAALGGSDDDAMCKRWARRGSYTPLGILEALAYSLSSGELAWNAGVFVAQTRAAGRGKPRSAGQWIGRRAELMDSAIEQLVLVLITLAGGELSVERLARVLVAANVKVDAAAEAKRLALRRWLIEPEPGVVALATRSHRDAIAGQLNDESLRRVIHRAIAAVLEQDEKNLGLAEAAQHLARAGDAEQAARLAITCARAAASLGLQTGANHLLAFAREQDPSCEEEARAVLAAALPSRGSARPVASPAAPEQRSGTGYAAAVPSVEVMEPGEDSIASGVGVLAPPGDGHDSEPPTVSIATATDDDADPPSLTIAVAPTDAAPPMSEPGPALAAGVTRSSGLVPALTTQPPATTSDPPFEEEVATGEDVGDRLTELAKEALLGADTPSLERWAEGLLATGEHGRFAERMQAIVRLSRGDVGEALRALRAARTELHAGASSAERCQTSLALGVALAVAGRPDEALLEALDALARAREKGDEKGAFACLAFLAKLYASVERPEDAARLRHVAQMREGRALGSAPA